MGLEYKIVSLERPLLDRVTCDRCGAEAEKQSEGQWNPFGTPYTMFHEPSFKEYFVIRKSWGYWSSKDNQNHEAVICENCYDEIFKEVKFKITPEFDLNVGID